MAKSVEHGHVADQVADQRARLAELERRLDQLPARPGRSGSRRQVRLAITVAPPGGGSYPARDECPNTYWIVFVDGSYPAAAQGRLTHSLLARQTLTLPKATAHNILDGREAYVPEHQLLLVVEHDEQWWFYFHESPPCGSSSSGSSHSSGSSSSSGSSESGASSGGGGGGLTATIDVLIRCPTRDGETAHFPAYRMEFVHGLLVNLQARPDCDLYLCCEGSSSSG